MAQLHYMVLLEAEAARAKNEVDSIDRMIASIDGSYYANGPHNRRRRARLVEVRGAWAALEALLRGNLVLVSTNESKREAGR